jgi:hypothetical protein
MIANDRRKPQLVLFAVTHAVAYQDGSDIRFPYSFGLSSVFLIATLQQICKIETMNITIINEASNVTITTDKDGRLFVHVDGHPHLQIEKVATMQLNLDSQQYISRTKSGVFIARYHQQGNCWCGKIHLSRQKVSLLNNPR